MQFFNEKCSHRRNLKTHFTLSAASTASSKGQQLFKAPSIVAVHAIQVVLKFLWIRLMGSYHGSCSDSRLRRSSRQVALHSGLFLRSSCILLSINCARVQPSCCSSLKRSTGRTSDDGCVIVMIWNPCPCSVCYRKKHATTASIVWAWRLEDAVLRDGLVARKWLTIRRNGESLRIPLWRNPSAAGWMRLQFPDACCTQRNRLKANSATQIVPVTILATYKRAISSSRRWRHIRPETTMEPLNSKPNFHKETAQLTGNLPVSANAACALVSSWARKSRRRTRYRRCWIMTEHKGRGTGYHGHWSYRPAINCCSEDRPQMGRLQNFRLNWMKLSQLKHVAASSSALTWQNKHLWFRYLPRLPRKIFSCLVSITTHSTMHWQNKLPVVPVP